jgi:opine dehydrogenase
MQLAVLGGGSAAYAAAAELALAGHSVRLWRRSERDLARVRSDGITIVEERPVVARLAAATADIAAAVAETDVVIVAVPATAHEELARSLAPHLDERQLLLLMPGYFGSYVVARELARTGGRLPLAVAETATVPRIATRSGPAAVTLGPRAARVPTGVFPATRTAAALKTLGGLYRSLEPTVDALSAALANAGPIVHPPMALLAAGAEATPLATLASMPAVRRLAAALDAERVATRSGWGYSPPHYEDVSYYDDADGPAALAAAAGAGPIGLDHRYVAEDVVLGLSLLESAARTAGVESPATTGLLLVFSVLTGRVLSGRGRALEHLGLGDLLLREIRSLLVDGWVSPLWSRVVR